MVHKAIVNCGLSPVFTDYFSYFIGRKTKANVNAKITVLYLVNSFLVIRNVKKTLVWKNKNKCLFS